MSNLFPAALAEPVIPVKQRVFPTPSQAAECGGPCYEGNYCPEACDCGLYQPPLSPAAQAVLDAFGKHPLDYDCPSHGLLYGALPAALRAAADQVAPECDMPILGNDSTHGAWCARNDVRDELLSIAAELEAL